MRHGARLGVDVGKARIGVARCDPSGLLATPLETVRRARDGVGADDVRRILELADEHEAIELVVGLPLGLSGHRTASTDDAEAFALRLAEAAATRGNRPPAGDPLSIRLVDERLSTVSAQGQLRQAGRSSRRSREIIDQAAAVVILQHALDAERALGSPPGTVVEMSEPDVGGPQ
ncbi:MAG: Holliday junction resolvase RuvX [Leucobacter sp.]|nr:Holliday junction resolvase RuvX [Leucobacter sp.]